MALESHTPKELVAHVNRMLFMEGQATYSGHVSLLDDDGETVHINPLTAARGEVRPADIVEIDTDSNPLDPSADPPVAEREIHTALYRERDDVNAVLHVHPPHATLFGITGTELQPVHIRGSILANGPVPVLDRPYLITDREDSDAMLDAMDGENQVLIRSHGAVVCDETIERAFVRAIYLEMNAYYQHEASSLGNPNPLTQEEVERINRQNWQQDRVVQKFWHYYTWKAVENGFLPETW